LDEIKKGYENNSKSKVKFNENDDKKSNKNNVVLNIFFVKFLKEMTVL